MLYQFDRKTRYYFSISIEKFYLVYIDATFNGYFSFIKPFTWTFIPWIPLYVEDCTVRLLKYQILSFWIKLIRIHVM